jgi:hypothetical protein
MNIQDAWAKALKETEIVRSRILNLQTFENTNVPYILLSASAINSGDTVVRAGEVMVDRPSLILPPNIPQFEGFAFDKVNADEQSLINFLLIRGVTLPSLKYNNKNNTLDIFEGRVEDAVSYYGNRLQREENTSAGLIVGPEDVWQFSLLIFICSQIAKNSSADIKRLIDEFRRRNS